MGGKQLGFGDYEQSTSKKRTRREGFLAEMEDDVPWKALTDHIEPHTTQSRDLRNCVGRVLANLNLLVVFRVTLQATAEVHISVC
jgi:hypothetical protein